MTAPRRDIRGERGATIVMVAFMLVALAAVAATVVDLAAARADRSTNQIAADAAASAAADILADDGGDGACQAAVGYLEESVGESISGISCGSFAHSCTDSTPSTTTQGTTGSMTFELVHPVPDTNPLMSPGAIGAVSQPIVDGDGDPCDRFGVRIEDVHSTVFGHVIGSDQLTTSIHAVAMSGTVEANDKAINLLLLEREDCEVLTVSGGGGGQGGIIVSSSIDASGNVVPGRIAVDSDASGDCTAKGVVNVDGSTGVIRADGEAGCADELPDAPGAGCGRLEIVAGGAGGCSAPACSSTGVVAPNPVTSTSPTTRAAIDWRYNCKASYPTDLDIAGCPAGGTTPAYIDTLVAAVGAASVPAGFNSYSDAGHPCTINNNETFEIPEGNWVVDCDLKIGEKLTFLGGNIIFDGDVTLSGQSALRINTDNNGSFPWIADSPFDIGDSSAAAAFVYLRDGEMSMGSQAELELDNVMAYVSDSSELDIGNGQGSVRWISPNIGPFEDLLLWSESNDDHKFAGGTSLELEGVLFAPHATFTYAGNSGHIEVAAQFIANKVSTNGAGLLELVPVAGRSVGFPESRGSLIR